MSTAGWKHTEESKLKIRETMRGRKRSEATKAKIKATLRRKWTLIRQIEERAA